jgi:hypothetical protein
MSTMSIDLPVRLRTLDPLLRPYLDQHAEGAAEDVLSRILTEQAVPIVRRIVGYKFRGEGSARDARETHEIDDICNDVLLQLLRTLRRARASGACEPIASFQSYVATAAYRGCDAYLREKHPERYRLRNRVQYLLSHHADFRLEKDEHDVWQCGLAAWRQRPHLVDGTARLRELAHSRHDLVDRTRGELSGRALVDTLARVLLFAGGPVKLDPLVTILFTASQGREANESEVDRLVDDHAGIGSVLEQQSHLRRLWQELLLLPQPQRVALLFNLRGASGEEVISFLPLVGIASIAEIGRAAGFEKEAFAAVWNELPWDDQRIATLLGVTRQQVINLRKSGRERLTRRMRTER